MIKRNSFSFFFLERSQKEFQEICNEYEAKISDLNEQRREAMSEMISSLSTLMHEMENIE